MNRHEFISGIRPNGQTIDKGLVCLLILLSLGVAAKTAAGLLENRSIAATVQESTEFLKSQNEKAKEYIEAYAKRSTSLSKREHFAPRKNRRHRLRLPEFSVTVY